MPFKLGYLLHPSGPFLFIPFNNCSTTVQPYSTPQPLNSSTRLSLPLPMIFDEVTLPVVLHRAGIPVAFNNSFRVGLPHKELDGIAVLVGSQHQIVVAVAHRDHGGGLQLLIDLFQQVFT